MGPQPVTGPAASGGQPQAGPPPAAGMAGTTHPHPRRPGSARSRFALSNWRVQWRLALLIAVPFLTAAVLGAVAINGDVNNWQTTGRVQHLAQLNSAVVKYIAALEDERDYSVASTANRAGFSARLRAAERVTDTVAAEIHALVNGITVGGGYQLVAVQAANAVQVGVETLPFVREAVADPLFPASAITQVYTVNIIQPANTLTSVVGNEASGTDLRRDVIALGALLQVQDSTSVQRAILLRAVSFPQPSLSSDDDASLQQAQRQEAVDLTNFNASVDPAEQRYYTDTVSGPPVGRTGHEESLALALLPGASSAHPLTPANARTLAAANVNDDMSFTIGKVRQVADELNGNISTLANASRTNAGTRLLVTSLVTVLLLLLVLLISTLVARSLTRPLRKLRTDALDVAGNRLPEMVRRLSQSEGADESVDIEPIDVLSTDEIGQVARAFDQVHKEAVRLAGEEALLRTSFNAMFVNLSRRSQSLIERLARMIDSLEQTEDDPDRLSNLFSMDHLVTRMRRNSENLLLLAGHEGARKWSEPVSLADVARAATSEIEQYSRVSLNIQPGVAVVGPAVSDAVHLLAELIENATMFSPKDTRVQVSAQELSSGGVLIEVSDRGIGVSESRLAEMNWRLDNPPVIDVSVSRHMGLFAVARLAERHGIRIRLRPAALQGMTALVWLPDSVVERTSRVFSGTGTWTQPAAGPGGGRLSRRASFQQGPGRRGIGMRSAPDGQDAKAVPAPSGQAGAGRDGSPGEAVPAASQPVSNWFRTGQPSPAAAEGGNGAGDTYGPGAGAAHSPGAAAQPAGAPGAAGAPGWGFATGAWSSARNPADIVADPVLGDKTAAGLPMRVPQANLIPGSPAGASQPGGDGPAAGAQWNQGSQPGPRIGSEAQTLSAPLPRSADLARSRLSGFQRGARRAESQAHRAEDGADR
jgi:signal transduction histidine kinase